jgi:hypothetical protein
MVLLKELLRKNRWAICIDRDEKTEVTVWSLMHPQRWESEFHGRATADTEHEAIFAAVVAALCLGEG